MIHRNYDNRTPARPGFFISIKILCKKESDNGLIHFQIGYFHESIPLQLKGVSRVAIGDDKVFGPQGRMIVQRLQSS